MDEKIEEMAKVCCFDDTTCVECFKQYEKFVWKSNIKEEDRGKHCQVYDNAKRLYKAGYRKESDTAREILTELYETKFKMFGDELIYADNIKVFAKKYGVDLGE
jgi:hypothetical protein